LYCIYIYIALLAVHTNQKRSYMYYIELVGSSVLLTDVHSFLLFS